MINSRSNYILVTLNVERWTYFSILDGSISETTKHTLIHVNYSLSFLPFLVYFVFFINCGRFVLGLVA